LKITCNSIKKNNDIKWSGSESWTENVEHGTGFTFSIEVKTWYTGLEFKIQDLYLIVHAKL
jgi:hypothetical protein